MSTSCPHLETIGLTELPDPIAGCEECLASGGWWVHLRMCQSCGHIGCCDRSGLGLAAEEVTDARDNGDHRGRQHR